MSGSRKIQCDEVLKCIKKIYRHNGNEVQTCLKIGCNDKTTYRDAGYYPADTKSSY